ncbi:MAG TPA: hypothetical protein VGG72_14225 [Bryobacteraceae bacterium]|jgi:hypothetical protein
MRLPISLILLASSVFGGPVDFGMAELNAAIDARNFKYKPKIQAELDIQAPETFRIEPYAAGGGHITGGDLRGLMYGLLEAAEQMRSTGRLKLSHGAPALALRGIRVTGQPDAPWFPSDEFWQNYFAGMARDRFNRLELVFESAPAPEALPALRSIAQHAAQYGIDLAIGLGFPDTQVIAHLLGSCPSVRIVVLHHPEGMANEPELLQILHDAGRRVVLELPDNPDTAGLIEAAGQQGAPLRLFSSFTGAASNPQPRDSYWQMAASQGADAVNTISGAGFEVASPLDAERKPELVSIAAWGRSGYDRPLPH